MDNQHLGFLPKNPLGWWSLGLAIVMPALFFVGSSFTSTLYQSIPSGDTMLADIAARPALALTMLAGMAAGISAFITGLVAIIRHKEKALLVYLSTVIGALLIIFLSGEFISPH
jgi:hypothetical protein